MKCTKQERNLRGMHETVEKCERDAQNKRIVREMNKQKITDEETGDKSGKDKETEDKCKRDEETGDKSEKYEETGKECERDEETEDKCDRDAQNRREM